MRHTIGIAGAVAISFAILCGAAQSETKLLCAKTKVRPSRSGVVSLARNLRVVSTASCPRGFRRVTDTSAFQGPAGTPGEPGSTTYLTYGDGSAGALNVTETTDLKTANLNFTDITIAAGKTLRVISGTIIRCTGSFTNNGTISVGSYAPGGYAVLTSHTSSFPTELPAFPSFWGVSASGGEYSNAGGDMMGGFAGIGIYSAEYIPPYLATLGPLVGGSGGAPVSLSSYNTGGGYGGGLVKIICAGALVNNGTITANGENAYAAGGGGGGGAIILASDTSITNSSGANLFAKGGNGGNATAEAGEGGGGGGGLIYYVASDSSKIVNSGTSSLSGGIRGLTTGVAFGATRSAGGGGGGSAGFGGRGASISGMTNLPYGSEDGSSGYSLNVIADPKSIFH